MKSTTAMFTNLKANGYIPISWERKHLTKPYPGYVNVSGWALEQRIYDILFHIIKAEKLGTESGFLQFGFILKGIVNLGNYGSQVL
ncbi:hypothetical protein SUGI_1009870 [Cryptomeria japonica]|nr:hypothetical protein SUGI_1009870 [Cryptomeria japonica]